MNVFGKSVLVLILTSLCLSAWATDPSPLTAEQEKVYHRLTQELRCLVCQNQSVADSNSDFANNVRQKIFDMLFEQNASEAEIRQYFVERYSDYISYEPPVRMDTWLLWALPGLAVLGGFWWWIAKQRRSAK